MYLLYSLLTAAGILLLSPYFLIRGLLRGKRLDNLPERLAWKFPARPSRKFPGAAAAKNHLAPRRLRRRSPRRAPARQAAERAATRNHRLVVSTTTATGQKLARERMNFADAIFYFPLDWTGPVRRALRAAQPSAVLIVETEIWPNFLRRVPPRSRPGNFRQWPALPALLRRFSPRPLLLGRPAARLSEKNPARCLALLMQGEEDAARLLALGAPQDRVLVTGNLKYDLAAPPANALSSWLAAELARANRAPVLIAGSVMAGEESNGPRRLRRRRKGISRRAPDPRPAQARSIRQCSGDHFAIGPRAVAPQRNLLERRPPPPHSQIPEASSSSTASANLPPSTALPTPYSSADRSSPSAATIFSSRPHSAKPPVFGPFMDNFREMAAAFLLAGASIRVSTPQELGEAWRVLLRDPQTRRAHGRRRQGSGRSQSRRDRARP